MRNLLEGKMSKRGAPTNHIGAVDIRDVAAAHIAAMERPEAARLPAIGGTGWERKEGRRMGVRALWIHEHVRASKRESDKKETANRVPEGKVEL